MAGNSESLKWNLNLDCKQEIFSYLKGKDLVSLYTANIEREAVKMELESRQVISECWNCNNFVRIKDGDLTTDSYFIPCKCGWSMRFRLTLISFEN